MANQDVVKVDTFYPNEVPISWDQRQWLVSWVKWAFLKLRKRFCLVSILSCDITFRVDRKCLSLQSDNAVPHLPLQLQLLIEKAIALLTKTGRGSCDTNKFQQKFMPLTKFEVENETSCCLLWWDLATAN